MAESPASSEPGSREGSEWWRRALSAGRLGTWEWDLKHDTVIWSREVLGIFGISEFAGTFAAWNKLVYPADLDYAKAQMERSLREPNGADFYIEHRAQRPDGTLVWVEGRGQIQRDDAGE